MTWYLQWSDSIKKRACRYLLQRYLGQYLEEKLTLDQLSVDIYCGTGSVSDVSLDVQALNELGEHKNLPFEFVDGFISNIAVSIPWANLFKDSIFVEVTGMQITIQPKQRPDNAASMLESMWSSMASSIQIAAECLKHESAAPEGKENENASNMEGLEIFASAIESILKRVKIKLLDTCVRLEHLPKDGKNGIAVEVKLKNIEYCDETTNDWNAENEIPDSVASEKSSYSIKKFHCSGISFYTDEFPVECRTFSRSIILDETNSNRSCDKLKDPLEPILIGKLCGYQEIRIKIKLDPSAQGPKVDLELNLGSFTFFLSPRQLYLLIEIMQSLASPHTQDSTNVLSKKNVGEKLMSSRDFKKIEQDLQDTLNFPAGFQIPQPNQNRGWSSPCLEDGEEEFLPMKLNNMTASCASVATNDTSYVSNTSAGLSSKEGGSIYESSLMGYLQHKKHEKNLYETETLEETSSFHVRLSSLAVVILHEDILTFGVDTYELTPSSVSTMRNLSSEFFEKLGKFALSGNKDFEGSKEGFMKCCRLNHLRLYAATIFIEGNDNRNESSSSLLSSSMSAASLELVECLVEGNSSSNGEPQYVELLKFMRSNNLKDCPIEPHFPLTNKPDLRMHFSRVKKHYHSKVIIKLDVSLQFEQCWTEVDLSILDRIATIINVQTLCRRNPVAKNTVDHNASFTQAVESAKHSDRITTIRVKSPFIVVKFRFPIPDLRPPHEKGRYPWWQRSVRKDVLYINLVDASFHTDINCEVAVAEYNLSCKDLTVLFQEGNTELPIPFIYASCNSPEGNPSQNNAYNSDNMPRLLVRLCPAQLVGEVEDFPEKEDSGLTCSTFMESPNSEPSPFMSKKVVHETDTHHHAASDGEELVIPGSKEDIGKFISHASEDAKVQVEISLPFLCLEFPTKHLYEVIYNRINSDLSLYQTTFPKTFEKDYSYLHPVFSMCKSGLQIESDGSDDEASETKNTIRNVSHHSQSNFSLNLSVIKGVLDIFPNLKDPKNILVPDKFGEMYFDLSNAQLFFVSNYKGKPQRNYVCLQVRTVEMFHKAVVENASKTSLRPKPPNYLDPVLLKSNNEIVVTSMSPEGHEGNMLTAAVSTEVSERRVKTIRVACSINQVTLRHRVSAVNQSWLSQLMDFFDVIDYPVKGYDSPQVITELHVHSWDSAIDYRPLYLPISCVITLGNLSISSNIAARTKTSTLRFIAEEASLFITDKMKNQVGTPDLQADYISVIQLGLFELSLRLSEQPNFPKVDLKASNNMLNIRTCADSAAALAQLITYYASDGDLTRAPSTESVGDTSETGQKVVGDDDHMMEGNNDHEVESGDLLNQSCVLTESAVGRVNDMMEDAMQEISNSSGNIADGHEVIDDNDVFYFPDEGNGFVSSPIDWGCSTDSDHDFCILELDTGIATTIPETGRPEVRLLSDKPIEIIEDHFNVAMSKSDLLLSPKFYPIPVSRYRLTNMAIIWHMYGGRDFATKVHKKNVKFAREDGTENQYKPYDETKGPSVNKRQSFNKEKPIPRRSAESIYHGKHPNYSRSTKTMNWQVVGGPNREHNVLMQLQFNKVKFQHEIYPEKSPQASRQVLLIHEFEIRDRLSTSQINKFLYQYTSETSPKQSHANMMTIKAVHLRPDSRQNVQETCLKVSILPLRLNIDQDSLQFLVRFFTELSMSSMSSEDDVKLCGVSHCNPVMGINEMKENETVCEGDGQVEDQGKKQSKSNSKLNIRSPPMFIRNFVFSPEVPIRIDYEGKRVDLTTYGPLKGLLIGLGQLNCLQIKLKRLSYKHGLLGIDKLVSFAINEWLQDIKKTQVPCLIGAVGPMHALVQLFQGIRDLFWLPIEQYQKDGRIVRGIQRGANSFTTSTAIAALELTARIVQAIQSIAEAAFDMVSPGPSVRRINGGKCRKQHNYSHPADIREGVANAYTLVKEGLGETAETLVRVASAEAEQKGAVGAVGGVLRQIPPTFVAPIILASAATTNLLGGVRSQLAPDSRREATYKWKKNVDDSKSGRHCK